MEARGIDVDGVVEGICISPDHDFRGHFGKARGTNGEVWVDSVRCVAGKGLEGDRYFGFKEDFKGQITFFDGAVYDEVKSHFDLPDLEPSAFRRNVIIRGVDLNELIGKQFELQGIVFEGSEECAPCLWMNEVVADGVEDFLKGRGGLRARILSDGILSVNSVG